MWKVKLDDKVWLANGIGGSGATTDESEACLFPDMPSVQEQLKKFVDTSLTILTDLQINLEVRDEYI